MAKMRPFRVISSGQIVATENYKIGAIDFTPGSADASMAIYDSTTSSGEISFKAYVDVSANADTRHFSYVPGIGCRNAFYAKIVGSGAEAIVYYYG